MVSINYKKRLGEKLIVCTLRIHLASGAGYFFRSMVLELFVRFFGVYSSLVSRLSPYFSLSLLFISIPSVICISLCFIVFLFLLLVIAVFRGSLFAYIWVAHARVLCLYYPVRWHCIALILLSAMQWSISAP